MFEYHFHGLQDGNDPPFAFTATTHDFIQVCIDVAKCYDHEVLGKFMASLFDQTLINADERMNLDTMRVTAWNFEFNVPGEPYKSIRLNKLI